MDVKFSKNISKRMNLIICIPRKHNNIINRNRNLQKSRKNYNETRKILQVTCKIFKHVTHNFYNRTKLLQNFEKISYVISKFITTYRKFQ